MILILSAFSTEQACLLFHINNKVERAIGPFKIIQGELSGQSVVLALTGMGLTNAAAVTATLIHALAPRQVLFFGCAGGIRHDLKVGDIIVGSEAFELDVLDHHTAFADTPYYSALTNPHSNQLTPEKFPASAEMLERVGLLDFKFTQETLVSSNAFPIAMHYFDMLKKEKYPCIDMESAAIYHTCWLFKTPALVVRTISNFIDDDGNEDTEEDSLLDAMINVTKFVEAFIDLDCNVAPLLAKTR